MGWSCGNICRGLILAVLVLAIIPAATGYAEELNETEFLNFLGEHWTVTDLDDIVYVDEHYKPVIHWQQKGHITAWLDIAGYKHMVQLGNNYYIDTDPAACAIVLHGIDHDIKGNSWFNYNVDKLTAAITSIRYDPGNNEVTAELTVNLKYHKSRKICIGNGNPPKCPIKKTYYYETAVFTVTDSAPPAPLPPLNLQNISASAFTYNNTLYPKTIITVYTGTELVTGIIYKYHSESITYYKNVYRLDKTSKGVPFGRLVDANKWRQDNQNKAIFHLSSHAVVKGNELDKNATCVILVTPFNKYDVSTINYTEQPIGRMWTEDKQHVSSAFAAMALLLLCGFFVKRIIST